MQLFLHELALLLSVTAALISPSLRPVHGHQPKQEDRASIYEPGTPAVAKSRASDQPTGSALLTGWALGPDGTPIGDAAVVTSAGGRTIRALGGGVELEVELQPEAREAQPTGINLVDESHLLVSNFSTPWHMSAPTARASHLTVATGCEPSWVPAFGSLPGCGSPIDALTVFDDGSGPAVYAGGNFTSAGGVLANRIAKWDGITWSPLGDGLDGWVQALAVFNDGSGSGPALYAGGGFTTAGGVPASYIAKWDGSTWSAVGKGMNSWVYALRAFDDGSGSGAVLYAGGDFTSAGAVMANRVAKWNGSVWSPLGDGLNGGVRALTLFQDGPGSGLALYAGGTFTAATGVNANRIAKWDGLAWSSLDSGVSGSSSAVFSLAVFDDGWGGGPALYAGGSFSSVGGVAANSIAKWNGSTWSPLGSGLSSGAVRVLEVFNSRTGGTPSLYAGGSFSSAGGVSANRIASWDGSTWWPLEDGISSSLGAGAVAALAVFHNDAGSRSELYAGGSFTSASGVPVKHIAKWDENQWSSLGNGLNAEVSSLAIFDDGSGTGPALYAGGAFIVQGSDIVSFIAKWNGSSWISLGSGVNGGVTALAAADKGPAGVPKLYAAGGFTLAGGVPVNRIASWDGSTWSPLAGGVNGTVRALEVFDDGSGPALYAGGIFTTAGGVPVNSIAKWDGSTWSPLGSGVSGAQPSVWALATFDDGTGGGEALYAGGFFTSAGSVTANYIAKWDGNTWSGLNTTLNNGVLALAVFDDGSETGSALYAGGAFNFAGAFMINRIARWQVTSGAWIPLGDGLDASVYSLAVLSEGSVSGPALYVGGHFSAAGGAAASHIAKWDGSTWSPLGGGVNNAVWAIEVLDNGSENGPEVYAGGWFESGAAGDSFLAKWQDCPPNVGVPFCFGDGSAANCPCGNPGGPATGCGNSAGSGAVLSGGASSEVAKDDLVLHAAGLLPGNPALSFVGLHAVNGGAGQAFGDGLRCVWGGIVRLDVLVPDAQGQATWGPGLSVVGGWQPGDIRRFQCWYRDPAFFGCAGFNLSNGLEVTFY